MINYRDYTHYGTFYGLPIYFDMDEKSMSGQNSFWDFLLFSMAPIIGLIIEVRMKLIRSYDGQVKINLQGEIDDAGNFRSY